jgi:hydroxyacylglutathione hydrolase
MNVQQLYTNCLSEAAYFISSEGEAAVIDPLRDVEVYIQMAQEQGVKIKYIFETHFHADFVSGHLELAQKTGAPIVYGPGTVAGFPIHEAKDEEVFQIGKLSLKAIHTPGHTLESTSYLLHDESGKPYCVFTGDTLFVGDVGRPDLFSGNLTKEELAGMMYETLQEKIKKLPDDVIVYPAHGPGSSCGKNLGPQTYSTIEEQKRNNYALQDMSKDEFIKVVTRGLSAPPAYFPVNARINQKGYDTMDHLMGKSDQALSIPVFKNKIKEGAWILDTRNATDFTRQFIPGAISIGLEGRFAEWAGNLIPFDQPLVLVADPGKEKESIVRLARVGFDKVEGYLEGGIASWAESGERVDMIIDIEPEELAMDIPHDSNLEVIDVRKEGEYEAGHVKGAHNIPLDSLRDVATIANINDEHNLYIHCAGGYRSVIAASLLKREGYHNLRNVLGGYGKIKAVKNMPIVVPDGQEV